MHGGISSVCVNRYELEIQELDVSLTCGGERFVVSKCYSDILPVYAP